MTHFITPRIYGDVLKGNRASYDVAVLKRFTTREGLSALAHPNEHSTKVAAAFYVPPSLREVNKPLAAHPPKLHVPISHFR